MFNGLTIVKTAVFDLYSNISCIALVTYIHVGIPTKSRSLEGTLTFQREGTLSPFPLGEGSLGDTK